MVFGRTLRFLKESGGNRPWAEAPGGRTASVARSITPTTEQRIESSSKWAVDNDITIQPPRPRGCQQPVRPDSHATHFAREPSDFIVPARGPVMDLFREHSDNTFLLTVS